MKKLSVLVLAMMCASVVLGQDKKVAVFDPAGSVDKTLKEIVREEISSIIVNSGGYTVLERQLIDKVLEENKFQTGGLVDDSQISEIGKRMGANLVFVTSLTTMSSGNFYISCKMIDVQTARIEQQKTAQTVRKSDDLIIVIQRVVNEMFGKGQGAAENVKAKEIAKPKVDTVSLLVADGKKVYMNGAKLSKYEVQKVMVNTEALKLYKKGVSKNKGGGALITFGTLFLISGITIQVLDYFDSFGEMKFSHYNENGDKVHYYDPWLGTNTNKITGTVMGVGTGMMAGGITLKVLGKKNIEKSVDMYNTSKAKSPTAELKLGFTGNGMNFILNF